MSDRPMGSNPMSPTIDPSSFSGTVRKGMDFDIALSANVDGPCGGGIVGRERGRGGRRGFLHDESGSSTANQQKWSLKRRLNFHDDA